MAADLEQFHDAFFEESLEAINSMESGLLNLDLKNIDIESINTIFRGAHSIKGCSATFGFNAISDFVHIMETVLDEMRDRTIAPSQTSTDLLLVSLDVLREMIAETKAGNQYDIQQVENTKIALQEILGNKIGSRSTIGSPTTSSQQASEQLVTEANEWQINFKPNMGLFQTGNDPLGMFSVLSELGEIEVEADTSELLNFRLIDPTDCCLSWNIHLYGNTTREIIEEVFEWVSDECEIEIKPANHSVSTNINTASSSMEQQVHNTSDKNTYAISSDTASIRVGTDKVDAIINMVGELVITQSMLGQLGGEIEEKYSGVEQFEKLREGLIQLERNTREIQESVMRIRMLPISYVFNRVPRIVHDLSKKLSKHAEVMISGEGTELDKTVLEKIGDPLVHLIRNALDHGIESPQIRKQHGKPESGIVHLNAYHKGGSIIIEIEDDGAGINRDKLLHKAIQRGLINSEDTLSDDQIYDMVFHPGLSTAEVVSDVSGRGVGMDVVRKNIKSLGGSIDVSSAEGAGTTFTIRLPLTLAILDGQLIRIGEETYIIPLVSIIESLQVVPEKLRVVAGQAEVYRLRDEYIPVTRLNKAFGFDEECQLPGHQLMVVAECDGRQVGLIVDELLGQQQVVIKSLETNYRSVQGISGATILGDGTVALIADIAGILDLAYSNVGNILHEIDAGTLIPEQAA